MQENEAPVLYTVAQFADKHRTWTTQPALRNLLLNARDRFNSRGEKVAGNGLDAAGAIVRIGRRILIDEGRFFAWLTSQQAQQRKAA